MSILNNLSNLKENCAVNFSNNILGMKNAIKEFVEAKKGEANQVDKSKKAIINKATSRK